jgi:hypothetical protein
MLINGESGESVRPKVLRTGEVRAEMVTVVVSDMEKVAIVSKRSIRLSIVCSAWGYCEGGIPGVEMTVNVGKGFSLAVSITRQSGLRRLFNCPVVSWCFRRVRMARSRLYGWIMFF